MKVELKDAKVELEVRDGRSFLHINEHCIELPKVVGVKLIFGEDVVQPETEATSSPPVEKAPSKRKSGAQSAASRKKLSASLKKFHAKKRRQEREQEKLPVKKVQPKVQPRRKYSHLNGASSHTF